MIKVAIIGAGGASGLVSCKEAKEHGMKVTGFESRDRIGGIWCSDTTTESSRCHAYQGLITNISHYSGTFPDFPWPEDTPDFANTHQMHTYLEDYAKAHNLHQDIQFGCHVQTVNWCEENKKWIISWNKEGSTFKNEFDRLIIAVGRYAKPVIPAFSGLELLSQDTYIHSSKFQLDNSFLNQKVLVVGNGNSGSSIAVELTQKASQVHHVFRTARWALEKFQTIHSEKLPWDIANNYRKDHPTIEERKEEIDNLCQTQLDYPELRPSSIFKMALVDNYFDKIKSKQIIPYKAEIKSFTQDDSVILTNEQIIKFDRVIFCTGYEHDFSFLPGSIQFNPNDPILYQHIFPSKVSHLAFVGMYPWASRFSILALQAELACLVLSGKKLLPSFERMQYAIEKYSSETLMKIEPKHYMEYLATEIGSLPSLEVIKQKNPGLFHMIRQGTNSPGIYKLASLESNRDGAIEVIFRTELRRRKAQSEHKVPSLRVLAERSLQHYEKERDPDGKQRKALLKRYFSF